MKTGRLIFCLLFSFSLHGCASDILTQVHGSHAADLKSPSTTGANKNNVDPTQSHYDSFINFAVAKAIPLTPKTDRIQYYAQVGDFFGGVWGTLLGAVTTILVLVTWISTRKIDARSKVYQIFAEILRTHEEIVSSWKIGNLTGRDALSVVLSEFYEGYVEISAMEDEGLMQLALHEKIEAAFLLTYYGSHPETSKSLYTAVPNLDGPELCDRIAIRKKSSRKKEILKKLSSIVDGDQGERGQWHNDLRECFKIVTSLTLSGHDKHHLLEVLTKAKARPYHKYNIEAMQRLIEAHSNATEFGGHQNRLSQYFRNLYSAFVFIDTQKLASKEKISLAKVLRSKLSNYEQALLALNSLTKQGEDWKKSGLLNRYMLIKNIPEHFFSFDKNFKLAHEFKEIEFDWKKPINKNFMYYLAQLKLSNFFGSRS